MQILWHFGVVAGKLTPEKFVELCCTAPARIFGMTQKGVLAPGKDADILLWDPQGQLHHLRRDAVHGDSTTTCLKAGRSAGNARHVFSRGDLVVKDGQWIGKTGRGRFLKREANAGGFA